MEAAGNTPTSNVFETERQENADSLESIRRVVASTITQEVVVIEGDPFTHPATGLPVE